MNLHEYQSKDLFRAYHIPCPEGRVVSSAADAVAHAVAADSFDWVVKAQVHAGGRGKAGGVRLVKDREGLEQAVTGLVGSRLVTGQGGAAGHPVNQVLLEPVTAIARELYLSMLVDREAERIAIIASAAGGMDIEAVAADTPERIIKVLVDPAVGLQPYQGRRLAFALGLETEQVKPFLGLLGGLYRLFTERDLSLVEINPLVVTADGRLLALDAKVNVDDNALARHPDLARQYDATQEDPKETRAKAFDLNYIALDGNIACMVNGAGLAMATMDLIKLEGGEPANFLDVGGGTTAERVTEAFKIILAEIGRASCAATSSPRASSRRWRTRASPSRWWCAWRAPTWSRGSRCSPTAASISWGPRTWRTPRDGWWGPSPPRPWPWQSSPRQSSPR